MASTPGQARARVLVLMILALLPLAATADHRDKRHGRIHYTLTDLGTLGGPFATANKINSSGQIVGSSQLAPGGPIHAFLYRDGSMQDLGTLGGMSSQGLGINELGQAVGSTQVSISLAPRGFLYSDGRMQQLNGFAIALGINNRGEVTGSSNGSQDALLYAEGQTISLGSLGGSGPSLGNAINAHREVVGFSSIPNGDVHAFDYRDGEMVDLGTFGGANSTADDINERGHITGGADVTDTEFPSRAFIYRHGRMKNLGTLGGSDPFSRGIGINNFDVVVGISAEFIGSEFASRAFIYEHGRMRDLNDLIDPTSPLHGYVKLTSADGINDSGWIAASGHDASRGEDRAYLLRPIRSKRHH